MPIRAAREHAGAIGREGNRSDPTRVRYLWNDLELQLAFRSSRDVSKQHKRNHGQHSKKNPEAQTLWEIALRVPQSNYTPRTQSVTRFSQNDIALLLSELPAKAAVLGGEIGVNDARSPRYATRAASNRHRYRDSDLCLK